MKKAPGVSPIRWGTDGRVRSCARCREVHFRDEAGRWSTMEPEGLVACRAGLERVEGVETYQERVGKLKSKPKLRSDGREMALRGYCLN
jgi:hypothetical protein